MGLLISSDSAPQHTHVVNVSDLTLLLYPNMIVHPWVGVRNGSACAPFPYHIPLARFASDYNQVKNMHPIVAC